VGAKGFTGKAPSRAWPLQRIGHRGSRFSGEWLSRHGHIAAEAAPTLAPRYKEAATRFEEAAAPPRAYSAALVGQRHHAIAHLHVHRAQRLATAWPGKTLTAL
jgi:hypothetical protein